MKICALHSDGLKIKFTTSADVDVKAVNATLISTVADRKLLNHVYADEDIPLGY